MINPSTRGFSTFGGESGEPACRAGADTPDHALTLPADSPDGQNLTDPSPSADHSIVWRRDDLNPAVTTLIDVIRELRDTGAFIPPELPPEPGRPNHSGATDKPGPASRLPGPPSKINYPANVR